MSYVLSLSVRASAVEISRAYNSKWEGASCPSPKGKSHSKPKHSPLVAAAGRRRLISVAVVARGSLGVATSAREPPSNRPLIREIGLAESPLQSGLFDREK